MNKEFNRMQKLAGLLTENMGGTDLESLQLTLERARTALTTMGVLTTAKQFENAATTFLGADYKAWVVPLLEANAQFKSLGNVHVFVWNGATTNTNVLAQLVQELQSRTYVGCATHVSNVNTEPLTVSVSLSFQGVSYSVVKANVVRVISDLLSYKTTTPGKTINTTNIGWRLLNIPGVIEVLWVLLNGISSNKPLPDYTIATLEAIEINAEDLSTKIMFNDVVTFGVGDTD